MAAISDDGLEHEELSLELPDEARQDRLLSALRRLVEQRGCGSLVRAPILEASERYFPDVWSPNRSGVRRLLRRLLLYAGLGELDVHVTPYREELPKLSFDAQGRGHGWGDGSAAWFAGIERDVCYFGVNQRTIRDEEPLVGTLCHEVAHAYRELHQLAVRSRDVEEELTDLTAVYLGFGVFILNNTHRFETGGYDEHGERLLYRTQSLGYLRAPDVALLLGAAVVARGAGAAERKRIRRALRPNQAHLFDAACSLLSQDAEALRARLGVPSEQHWPSAPSLAELTRPLPHEEQPEESEDDPPSAPAAARAPGPPTFRVRSDKAALYAFAGGALATPLLAAPIAGTTSFAVVVAAVVGGALLGKRAIRYRCSNPDCRATLGGSDATCSACGRSVAGTIAHEVDRLEAEERWEREHAREEIDEPEPEPLDAEQRILTGVYIAWLVARGLVAETMTEAIVRRARGREGRPSELCDGVGPDFLEMLSDEGAGFTEDYFHEHSAECRADIDLLATSALSDTWKLYERYEPILDARFAEWRSVARPT